MAWSPAQARRALLLASQHASPLPKAATPSHTLLVKTAVPRAAVAPGRRAEVKRGGCKGGMRGERGKNACWWEGSGMDGMRAVSHRAIILPCIVMCPPCRARSLVCERDGGWGWTRRPTFHLSRFPPTPPFLQAPIPPLPSTSGQRESPRPPSSSVHLCSHLCRLTRPACT